MSLQSCLTLCDPIDSSLSGSPVPGILQARTLEWVAIAFSNAWKWKVKVKSLSPVWLVATPWTAAYQAPPSMGFSRQEYWSGVPLPSPIHCNRLSYLRSLSETASFPFILVFLLKLTCFGNQVICLQSSLSLDLLLASSWCNLTRSSVFCIFCKLTVKSRSLTRILIWLFSIKDAM